MVNPTLSWLREQLNRFDWKILIFMLLISQDRILIKIAALAFIYLANFNFKFGIRQKRIPVFYLAIIILELIKYFVMGKFYLGNWATMAVSSLYWGISFFALHQLRLSADKNDIVKLRNTIIVFTVISFCVCMSQLIQVMLITQSFNPYSVRVLAPDIRFTDVIFPYGQSSGDQLRGLFYDTHQNAIISVFCFVFFFYERKYLYMFLHFVMIVLICFNLFTALMFLLIGLFFLISKTWKERGYLALMTLLLVLFYVFVSPENYRYLRNRIIVSFKSVQVAKKLYEAEALAEKKSEPVMPKVDSALFKSGPKPEDRFVYYNFDEMSGKTISYRQTFSLYGAHPIYPFFGTGGGMFSSKLANNMSGVFYGPTLLNKNLPVPEYEIYKYNHGSIFRYLLSLEIGKHSINNFPNSVYNQLISEYGSLGCLLFLLFYVFYFAKRWRRLTYGLVLLPLLLIAFNYGYFFESTDLTVFFEFLMFMNLKQRQDA